MAIRHQSIRSFVSLGFWAIRNHCLTPSCLLGVHFLFLQQKRKWTKRKRRRISIFLKVSEMRAHPELLF